MVRRWETLSPAERRIVKGLVKATKSPGPTMVSWLDEVDALEGDVWVSVATLADVFEKHWKR